MKTKIKWPLSKKTQRLVIRPLALHDYENWRQARSLPTPPKNEWDQSAWKDKELTRPKFKALLKSDTDLAKKDQFYNFGIFRQDDGVLVGHIALMDVSRGIFQNAYLGYQLFNIYWGEGYAKEACLGIMELAFKQLKLHRVEAGISPKNKSSIAVAKAIGLKKEGLSPKRLLLNGVWSDMLIFAKTASK